jgi:hypothetical protein
VAAADRVAVTLVTGPGGAGKTRLARELGEQAAGLAGRRTRCRPGTRPCGSAARAGGQPVLLVADYAETRTGLPAMLAAAAVPGGPAVRVLLLARSDGEWRQQLQRGCADPVRDLLPADLLLLEGVLDLVAGLLEVSLGLVRLAFSFQVLVVGGLAHAFLDLALDFRSLVSGFVLSCHALSRSFRLSIT